MEAAAGPEGPSAAPEGRAAASAAGRTGPPSRRPSRLGHPASAWLPAGCWKERSERISRRSSASTHRSQGVYGIHRGSNLLTVRSI